MNAIVTQLREMIKTRDWSVENKQADAGPDGGTCLARPNSQARTETEKYGLYLPCSADHEQDWQPCTLDPYYNNLLTSADFHWRGDLEDGSSRFQMFLELCYDRRSFNTAGCTVIAELRLPFVG